MQPESGFGRQSERNGILRESNGKSRSKTGNRRVARGSFQNVGPGIIRGPEGGSKCLANIDRAFETALSIDDLAALGGFHTTTKTALSKLLNSTLTRIFHSL